MSMAEDNLRRVIAENTTKITKFASEYQSNESAVQRTLVEPILEALGWNVKSLEDVRTELVTEDKQRLDYMLRKKGKDLLVVEAKAQRVTLENHLNQLAVYCTNLGVSFGVITNGKTWILFKAFEEGVRGRDRIVFTLDTTKEDANISKLLRISKERIEELGLLKEQMLTFQEIWDQIISNPDVIVGALRPRVAQLLENQEGNLEFQEEDLTMFLRERVEEVFRTSSPQTRKPPRKTPEPRTGEKGTMWIDETSYPIRKYNEIIVNTAEWLIKSGHLSHVNVPIQLGPTRYLVNATRANPKGKSMVSPKKLSNGLYLETNASGYDCERWARKLMNAVGLDESLLRVVRSE